MIIATADEIRTAEQQLFATGAVTSGELMDAVIERLWQAWQREALTAGLHPQRVVVYAGRGNNAGDALGLAARFGCPVTLRSVCEAEELSPDSRRELFRITTPIDTERPTPQPGLLIIDGLLGSGARGELRPAYAELVREMNTLRAESPRSLLLSIDIPTGLNADNGRGGAHVVMADITAAIGCVKPGMLVDGAEDAVGRLLCIPLPEVTPTPCSDAQVLCPELTRGWLPRRPYSHFKNRAGRVGIIAGSKGMIGAAQMCAEAAVAAGAGLVNLYCPEEVCDLLAARVTPEVMVSPLLPSLMLSAQSVQAWVIGPGIGHQNTPRAENLLQLISHATCPVVLDADALNTAAERGWTFRSNHILTPHPGEMNRLQALGGRRRDIVQRFTEANPCTLLLKGARSIIADRNNCYYNVSGGPFMANGGQGDVLAGTIGALAAQGLAPLRAAALGAFACGRAAEAALAATGYPPAIRAGQVIAHLPQALSGC